MKIFPRLGWLVVASLFLTSAFAEGTEFDWSLRAGGEGNDKIRGIAATKEGGVFVTGEISGETDFGSHSLVSAGTLDFVVAKIDKEGRVLWASHAGGAGIDRGYGVSPTKDGGCYVTGHFESETIRFGDVKLKNAGNYDGFVARYSADGECLWATRFGGPTYDYGHGIATAPDGSAVMAGTVSNSGDVDGQSVGVEKSRSAVLAKFSADGKSQWVKAVSGPSLSGHNVAVGKDGSIYLCGLARGKVRWSDKVETESKVQDICLAKYDSKGAFEWVKTGGGDSNGLATAAAVDEKTGNVCISGMFKAKARFGTESFASFGGHDFYAAVLSPKGEFLKAHHGGGVGTDYGLSCTAVPSGGFAMTGELSNEGTFNGEKHKCTGERDAYVATFSGAGEAKSFTLVGGIDHDLSYAIAATTDGALIISGAFRKETQFGDTKLEAKKGNDLFVTKLRVGSQ